MTLDLDIIFKFIGAINLVILGCDNKNPLRYDKFMQTYFYKLFIKGPIISLAKLDL